MSSPGIGGDLFTRFDRLSGLKRMNVVETSESRPLSPSSSLLLIQHLFEQHFNEDIISLRSKNLSLYVFVKKRSLIDAMRFIYFLA